MSKIVIYEHVDFDGRTKEFTSNVPNLITHGFNDIVSSVKVHGRPWLAFHDCGFKGEAHVFEEGEHASVPVNDVISSLMLLSADDLSHPQITLYEKPDYQGHSITLTDETNFAGNEFNDKASSHKVQKGVWVLYENGDLSGIRMVARAGQDVPQYDAINNLVTVVHPVKA